MTIRTALEQGSELLGRDGIASPRLTAEVLLGHAVHCERSYFYAHPEQQLREVEWLHYGRYLDERLKGKPTQYITKRQEFYGREFRLSRDVLIPRPETEHLVEAILKLQPAPGTLVDVGTGSGAIAITLALELGRPVIATDLSAEALPGRASECRPPRRRRPFHRRPICSKPSPTQPSTSSSPIRPTCRSPTAQPCSAKCATRSRARLLRRPHRLDVYKRLIPEARRVLQPGGLLALELGFGQVDAVTDLARSGAIVESCPTSPASRASSSARRP